MNNNHNESYFELRNDLKKFLKDCDHALSVNEIKDAVSELYPGIMDDIEKETAEEICDFIDDNHVRDSYYNRWISWIRRHMSSTGVNKDVPLHNGSPRDAYDMSYECAQEYISMRGLDIAINDGEVFTDERYITQTIANVLRWADNHQLHAVKEPDTEDSVKNKENCKERDFSPSVPDLTDIVLAAINDSGSSLTSGQKNEINDYFSLIDHFWFNYGAEVPALFEEVIIRYFKTCNEKTRFSMDDVLMFIKNEIEWKSVQNAVSEALDEADDADAMFLTMRTMLEQCSDEFFSERNVSKETCLRFVDKFLMKGVRDETEYEKEIRSFVTNLLNDKKFCFEKNITDFEAELMLNWIKLNP